MNAIPLVRVAIAGAGIAIAATAAAADMAQTNLAVAKAASDVTRASIAACGSAPSIGRLRSAFAEAGAGLPLVAIVYTRAPFAGAQAAGVGGPAFTLDEAWQAVQSDHRARASFEAWGESEYDAAVLRLAAGLCAPAGGKR